MTSINVDFTKQVGRIKEMHQVGQPPFATGILSLDFSPIEIIRDAGITYSRLHDVGGAFGGNRYVDIPNIFRDFDADENDPNSYDFVFTDELLKGMHQYGLKPIFRLGVTIENQAFIKAYRIHPPKDPKKWARICEHIIRHYNEGWANGFNFGIEYWEIWNEPDNRPYSSGYNQMWTGTAEQFYELYDVTTKHLKACFGDSIKVGGYGASGMYGIYYHPEKYGVDVPKVEPDKRYEIDIYRVEFFIGFLEYITAHSSPIDFFSWHSYTDVGMTLVIDEFIHSKLSSYGFEKLERQLNEWNNAAKVNVHGRSYSSAAVASMMCAMQNSHTDMLCYYDSRLTASRFGGFFKPLSREPVCTYYAFKMFNELYNLKNQVECIIDEPSEGFYSLAASDGEKSAVMIVNHSEDAMDIKLNVNKEFSVYLLDENHFITKTDYDPSCFAIDPNEVLLVKN